jgi:pyruvate-formate lyase-activating enzyme
MIHIKSEQIDLFVTPNHELYVDLRMSGKWSGFTFLSASRLSEISVLSRMIKGGVTWLGVEREFFELPSITYGKNQFSTGRREVLRIPMDLWLEFFGYYISEGSTTFNKANNGYIVQIAQSMVSSYYNDIKICLEQLGFNFCYASSAFQISNKQLYDYLNLFGKSADKFIPSDILSLSRRQLRILFDALMKGDGCLSRNSYYTVSKRLMDNIQEIALKIGMCGNIKVEKNHERHGYGYSGNAYSMVINRVKLTPSIKNYGKTRKRGYISNELYVGKVYCCEVPNHLIYVRRNGVPIWSGNSRGCPYACAFCSTIWQRVRFHSAEYVLKELTEIQSYGFNAVNFFDDVFTLKRERLKTICGGLKARRMSWRCFITGNTVTEAMLSLMSKSGCKEVAIGIESGSDRILQAIHKRSTSEKNKKAIQIAHDAGLQVKGFIIIGLPGESEDTIAETEAFINECPCDDYDFSLLSVLPGSDIYRNHGEYDLIHNTSKVDYGKMWYKGTPGMYEATEATISLSSIELTEARDKLEKKYKPEAKLK